MTEDLKLGTKDGIFGAKREYVHVDIPEWGGVFRLRSMTGKERDEFEAGLSDRKGRPTLANFRAKLVGKSLVNEDDSLMFTNSYEIDKLGDGPVAPLQRAYNAATALNAMSDEDIAELTTDFDPAAATDESSTSA